MAQESVDHETYWMQRNINKAPKKAGVSLSYAFNLSTGSPIKLKNWAQSFFTLQRFA